MSWKVYLILLSLAWKQSSGQSTISMTETTTSMETAPPLSQAICNGSWSEWSHCFPGTTSDPTSFQDRIFILSPSQFDAPACNASFSVNAIQIRSCISSDLPIDDLEEAVLQPGYFQCGNHRQIPNYLTCNGDDDCGDNSDEYPSSLLNCSKPNPKLVCGYSQDPGTSQQAPIGERYLTGIPGIAKFAAGYDLLTGSFRGNVLSMAGHGSCRRVLIAGSTDTYYRLPQNVASLLQLHEVAVDSGKLLEGGAEILNVTKLELGLNLQLGNEGTDDISKRTGLTQSDIIKDLVTQTLDDDQEKIFVSVGSEVTTAKITLKDAASLEVTTEFMEKVMSLPYQNISFSKYMEFIEDFGTHYVSSGNLGGTFTDTEVFSRCWLDKNEYNSYSSRPWNQNLQECARLSLFNRLNPNTSELPSNCKKTSGDTTKTLRDEADDYYVSITGGSIDTSSNLKFAFEKENWDNWIASIVNAPTLNVKNFRLEKISSLVTSSSIPMSSDRKEAVARNIDHAIELYLNPYDAVNLCEPCPVNTDVERFEFNEEGEEYIVENYGTPYLTGTGEDYKCHCVYNLPKLETTCGAMANLATIVTFLFSIIAAYWNLIGN